MNSAALNTEVHTCIFLKYGFLWIACMHLSEVWFFLDICPEVGLVDHMATLFLVFLGNSILFSIVIVPIYIPTNSVIQFPHLHTLSSICYLLTF